MIAARGVAVVLSVSLFSARQAARPPPQDEYSEFVRDFAHHRDSPKDSSVSLAERRALFESTRAGVDEHNAKGASWVAVLNYFADYTDSEKSALLGYKRTSTYKGSQSKVTSFLDLAKRTVKESIDWRESVHATKVVKSQGGCGSCWAVASIGALETRAEIAHGKPLPKELSHNQLVDCTPNKRHCGGAGGCSGSTPELAYEYVKENGGIAASGEYLGQGSGNGDIEASCQAGAKLSVSVGGAVRLETNKYQPLLEAVNDGPVVVSVDAGPWFVYGKGVFDKCPEDPTVNHSVLNIGYGELHGKKYWLIRNSWGQKWGDEGTIKILRNEDENAHCGTDHNMQEGVGCDDTPKEEKVCGCCGIISDAAYPTDVKVLM